LSLFRYFGFLNSFQDVLHILVYMSKFVGVRSGKGALLVPTQSPIFALGPDIHVNLSADNCISASKLSLLFAPNIVFCHSNVAKWEIMGGPILKSFPCAYYNTNMISLSV